jgi:hypothetical protein
MIFHCKTLQNFPKFGFLVWKQTIWQPRLPLFPLSHNNSFLSRETFGFSSKSFLFSYHWRAAEQASEGGGGLVFRTRNRWHT